MTTFASNTLALGPDFISADSLAKAGLAVVLLIVFAESGLLVGFFLPGDSLLFTLGLLISRDEVSTPLWLACALIGIAAIAGDQVGYLFGRKVGPALFRREDSRLFKQEYVDQAQEFFEKYGARSIVLARFVPIVRTFTPVIAGVSRMNYRTFVIFNVIGGVLWGCGVTVLGFFLGKIDFIRDNVEAMLILIVLISVLPIAVEVLRSRRRKAAERGSAGAAGSAAGQEPAAGSHYAEDLRASAAHGPAGLADQRGYGAGSGGYGAEEFQGAAQNEDLERTTRIERANRRGGGRHSATRNR
ncbi:DedA family protein [Parafrankia sp. FMc2]|uniref:DedA family protein n=1 Tax=Parafrankia sp. FMc2 TaxID=3233196 RepID=UPI0034D6F559